MRGHLMMSQKERERKVLLSNVKQGYLSLREAALRLNLSYRQTKRIYKRYCAQGDKGLLHKRRGSASNRAYSASFKQAVIGEYQTHYEGFGPTFAAEKLAETGYIIHHDTLRRWLVEAGLWERKRKRSPYRQRRERRACFGELLQLDGSHHAWFGERTPLCCLMNLVDDATGITMSLLAEEETTEAAMLLLQKWIKRYGIPKEIYVDLKNVYISPQELKEEADFAEKVYTVFGEACRKLGVVLIKAYSPQAKGRVERNHAVYQDRLVKEIALQQFTEIEQVNHFLQTKFTNGLNTRFAKTPASNIDAHRPLTADYDLQAIFCWETTRQLMNDWTIQYRGEFYQAEKDTKNRIRPKRPVIIKRHLDNSLTFIYQDNALPLAVVKLTDKPLKQPIKKRPLLTPQQRSLIAKEASKNSSWRIYNPERANRNTNQGDISNSSG